MTKTHEAIRNDLNWLVHSPLLVSSQLCFLKVPPKPITPIPDDLVVARKPPIGRYFEKLVRFWFQSQSDITAIHQNITVMQDKRTLGEFDLLFTHQSKSFHLELAVKFYLGIGDRQYLANWYGPMARDRFDLKLTKMDQQQILLSRTAAGKDVLQKLGMENVIADKLIKGRLFHPFEDWLSQNFISPADINPQHDKGWWIYQSRIDTLLKSHKGNWVILQKPDWFALIQSATPSDLISASQLSNYIDENSPPSLLVAAIDASGNELHRGFIQQDSWPNT